MQNREMQNNVYKIVVGLMLAWGVIVVGALAWAYVDGRFDVKNPGNIHISTFDRDKVMEVDDYEVWRATDHRTDTVCYLEWKPEARRHLRIISCASVGDSEDVYRSLP